MFILHVLFLANLWCSPCIFNSLIDCNWLVYFLTVFKSFQVDLIILVRDWIVLINWWRLNFRISKFCSFQWYMFCTDPRVIRWCCSSYICLVTRWMNLSLCSSNFYLRLLPFHVISICEHIDISLLCIMSYISI